MVLLGCFTESQLLVNPPFSWVDQIQKLAVLPQRNMIFRVTQADQIYNFLAENMEGLAHLSSSRASCRYFISFWNTTISQETRQSSLGHSSRSLMNSATVPIFYGKLSLRSETPMSTIGWQHISNYQSFQEPKQRINLHILD